MDRSRVLFRRRGKKGDCKVPEGHTGATMGLSAPEGESPQASSQVHPQKVRGDMKAAIDRFLSQQGRRWSRTTVVRYAWYLRNLLGWLQEEYGDFNVYHVGSQDLARWLDARISWSPSTQYTGIVAVRNFFRWLVGKANSPAEALPLPKRIMRLQRTLDEVKLQRIFAALDTATPKGIRDLAMLTVLLDTGLRAAEVCALRHDHVDLEGRTLTCRIKGGRWATGVFSNYTRSCIETWVPVREKIARAESDTLFVGIGGIHPGTPITRDGLRAIFRQLGKKSGVGLISPHDFRRTFATLALRGGAPSRLVQVAGRWNSLEMVERYSQAIVPADFDPYSPVDRLMGLRVKPPDEAG